MLLASKLYSVHERKVSFKSSSKSHRSSSSFSRLLHFLTSSDIIKPTCALPRWSNALQMNRFNGEVSKCFAHFYFIFRTISIVVIANAGIEPPDHAQFFRLSRLFPRKSILVPRRDVFSFCVCESLTEAPFWSFRSAVSPLTSAFLVSWSPGLLFWNWLLASLGADCQSGDQVCRNHLHFSSVRSSR